MRTKLICLALGFMVSGCVISADNIPMVNTLEFGSADSVYYGCVRGIIQWQWRTTNTYPQLDAVHLHCETVRRTFQEQQNKRKYGDL